MRKNKHRGILRVGANFILNLIAYNLINPQCEMKIPKSARNRSHEQQKNPKPSSCSVNC
jgi:hypothetical protein